MADLSGIRLVAIGRVPNDGTGDTQREAWIKMNTNVAILVAAYSELLDTVAGYARAGVNGDITSLVNFVQILEAARAAIPMVDPGVPGKLFLNGGLLGFSPDPSTGS